MFQGIYSRTVRAFHSSLASSPRTTMSATYKQAVDKAIADHKIVIFSKSYCPYCARAKRLLTSEFAHLKDQIYIEEYVPLSFTAPSKVHRSTQARRIPFGWQQDPGLPSRENWPADRPQHLHQPEARRR